MIHRLFGNISNRYSTASEPHMYVEIVHFFSDGLCTQYRQKANYFYLFSKELHALGFNAGTCNFSEAEHGKGAANGIGGAVKQSADRLVSQGQDISSPKLLCEVLSKSETSICLYFVEDCVVREALSLLPSTTTIPGTMSIHQLICTKPGSFLFHDVSCFCSDNKLSCTCYNVTEFNYAS